MAQNRPNKPSVTLPDNFGGVKSEFSSTRISNGYESSTPEIVEGGNLNYMLDGLFQNTKYMRTVLDYVRDTPVGRMFWVNSNGQMDYIQPAVIATNTEFNTGTATDRTPNVKQVVDKFATKSDDNSVVHKTGNETIAGIKTFSNELEVHGDLIGKSALTANSGAQLRLIDPSGSYGMLFRNDATNTYIFPTAQNDPYGQWDSSFKGIRIDNSSGIVHALGVLGNGPVVTDLGTSDDCIKLSNGIMIQLGSHDASTGSISFTYPFISTNYKIVTSEVETGHDYSPVVNNKTTTGFNWATARAGDWIAIGRWY